MIHSIIESNCSYLSGQTIAQMVDEFMVKIEFIEIGINHNGSIDLAKKHIEKAKEAGADIAKFQTYFTESRTKKGSPIYEI